MIHAIDLQFQQVPGTIAAFLIETRERPVLVESGPYSTFESLRQGAKRLGYSLQDIGDVFLTHIHLDHGGAAWALAELGARVHVHPFGESHLLDPTRLWSSAERIYGDRMEALWGSMRAIPRDRLKSAEDGAEVSIGDVTLRALHTPGHARHHIAWLLNGSLLFAGDLAGVKLGDGPVQIPCPPPDIEVEQWKASLQRVRDLEPEGLYLTHFGRVPDARSHLDAAEQALDSVAAWIRNAMQQDPGDDRLTRTFADHIGAELSRAGLGETQAAAYELINPHAMNAAGMKRYWSKREAS